MKLIRCLFKFYPVWKTSFHFGADSVRFFKKSLSPSLLTVGRTHGHLCPLMHFTVSFVIKRKEKSFVAFSPRINVEAMVGLARCKYSQRLSLVCTECIFIFGRNVPTLRSESKGFMMNPPVIAETPSNEAVETQLKCLPTRKHCMNSDDQDFNISYS